MNEKEYTIVIISALIFATIMFSVGLLAGLHTGQKEGYIKGQDNIAYNVERYFNEYCDYNISNEVIFNLHNSPVGTKMYFDRKSCRNSQLEIVNSSNNIFIMNPNPSPTKEFGLNCGINYTTKINSSFIGCVLT